MKAYVSSTCLPVGGDLSLRRPEGAGVGAREDAFAGDHRSALDVVLPRERGIRERFPECAEEIGLRPPAQLHPAWHYEFGVVRIGR
jgi:hypothetical protein